MSIYGVVHGLSIGKLTDPMSRKNTPNRPDMVIMNLNVTIEIASAFMVKINDKILTTVVRSKGKKYEDSTTELALKARSKGIKTKNDLILWVFQDQAKSGLQSLWKPVGIYFFDRQGSFHYKEIK